MMDRTEAQPPERWRRGEPGTSWSTRLSARWSALRARYAWFDRLVRAVNRYVEYHGYHYAASITYFTVLSLLPLLLVALAVASFVLAGQPALLNELRTAIAQAVPRALDNATDGLVNGLIDHRVKIGVVGLAVALYSGWNWMNALRDALTAMWDQKRPQLRVVPMVLKDLLALVSLAGAILVSFALTAVGGELGQFVLHLVGLRDAGWPRGVLSVLSVVLAVAANWLVFIWVLAKLPREPVEARSAVRGALAAAIGFEVLKWLGNIYLQAIGRSPIGITFGWIVGLLVFIYLVARMLMLVAAWTATTNPPRPRGPGDDHVRADEPAESGPARHVEPATGESAHHDSTAAAPPVPSGDAVRADRAARSDHPDRSDHPERSDRPTSSTRGHSVREDDAVARPAVPPVRTPVD
jgi:membrane protein